MPLDLDHIAPDSQEPEVVANANFDAIKAAIDALGDGAALPEGGTTGQVLSVKADGTLEWRTITFPAQVDEVPDSGTTGYVLYKTAGGVAWGPAPTGGGGATYPAGGTTGQVLAKASNADNDVVWKNDAVGSGGGGSGGSSENLPHAYWRVRFLSSNSPNYLSCYGLQFRSVAGTAELVSGGTILEFGTRGGFSASDAFDGSDTTRWALDYIGTLPNAYLGYHFAAPKQVNEVWLYCPYEETPHDYNIEWSDDGAAWTVAKSVVGQTIWGNSSAAATKISLAPEASGGSLPPGGTAGQILAKLSSDDGDATWINPPTGGTGGGGGDGTDPLAVAPLAAQFSIGTYGRGASKPAIVSDVGVFGMKITDDGTETAGYCGAIRSIPVEMRGAFTFITRIKGTGILQQNSGCGALVTNNPGSGDAGGAKTMFAGRHGNISTTGDGVYGGYNNGGSYQDLPSNPRGFFEWVRVTIVGNVATMYVSGDGLNWTPYATQDFGVPITHYGFELYHNSNNVATTGKSAWTIKHFESTEFPGPCIAALAA
jgi:hypothetical protein